MSNNNHPLTTPAEELGRFVVVTSKADTSGGRPALNLMFFDKSQKSDYIAQTTIHSGPAQIALVGSHVVAWQENGVMMC